MNFDWGSAVARGRWAEKMTHGVLSHGWNGARNVRYVAGQHRDRDHLADFPDRGENVPIDTKIVQARYRNIFWETRHEDAMGSKPGWGVNGSSEIIFYYMPDPLMAYVIDVPKAREVVACHEYREFKLDRPSQRNGNEWWTFGCLIPLAHLGEAIIDTIEFAEPDGE